MALTVDLCPVCGELSHAPSDACPGGRPAPTRMLSVEDAARFAEEQAQGLANVASRAGVSPAVVIADRMRDELDAASPPPAKVAHRCQIIFSDEAWQDLNIVARAKGCTIAEVLRDAIALARWFDDQQAAGNRVLIQRGRRIHEVLTR